MQVLYGPAIKVHQPRPDPDHMHVLERPSMQL